MHRSITTFVTLITLLVSGSALSQSYPPEFAGAMFGTSTGTIPVEMCLTLAENLPYSVPDPPPCDDAFWSGTFVGAPQASGLAIDFFVDGGRVVCAAPSVWHERIFAWNPDVQAYARLAADPEMPWVVSFEIVSIDWSFEFATYREGAFVFSGHPPVWWVVSEDHPYFEYLIRPARDRYAIYYTE